MANVSTYKSRNKLRFDDNCRYKQSQFIPQNQEKIIGDPRILCRSSWELKVADWCDRNPQVLKWGSEIVPISYRDPSAVNISEAAKYNLDVTNPINWPIKNYYPDMISGGMCQRVAIARALVNDAPIIFADEPVGALDSKMGNEILELLEKINKEKNKTIIMVTHLESNTQFATRVINILDGKILSDIKK